MEITSDIVDFIESGVSILVGTASDRLMPSCCRAMGARVDVATSELIVFVPAATSAQTLNDLEHGGRVAVCFGRPTDHRSLQLKGSLRGIESAEESDRQTIHRCRLALAEAWGEIGIPPRITLRMAHWPSHRIRIAIDSMFNQTPGPGAGASLGV